MATRNIVPRANGEGSIGRTDKHWKSGFFDNLNIGGKDLSNFMKTVLNGANAAAVRKALGVDASTCGGIVAGSLGQNGWVKFSNGLIIQWLRLTEKTETVMPLPISMNSVFATLATNESFAGDHAACPIGAGVRGGELHVVLDRARCSYVLILGC